MTPFPCAPVRGEVTAPLAPLKIGAIPVSSGIFQLMGAGILLEPFPAFPPHWEVFPAEHSCPEHCPASRGLRGSCLKDGKAEQNHPGLVIISLNLFQIFLRIFFIIFFFHMQILLSLSCGMLVVEGQEWTWSPAWLSLPLPKSG